MDTDQARSVDSVPTERADVPAAGELLHIPLKEHLGVTGVHVVVMILVMAVTMFGVIAIIASRAMSIVPTVLSVGVVLAFPFSLLVVVSRRSRRAASTGLGPTDGDELRRALESSLPRIRGFAIGDGLKALVATLSQRGHAGLTLRLGGAAEDKLEPFEMPFEPQPLDETASPLILEHIRDAGGASAKHVDDSAAARKLRRNIMLRGGWFVLVAFGINWVLQIVDSIREWRITPTLVLWSIFFPMLLLVSPTAQRRKQWYLVPGGLAIRDRPWLRGQAVVRVLSRQSSVLCLALVSTTQWRGIVAGGTETDSALLTADEAAALIRAWRSPLPSPSVERLADLF